MIRDSVEDFPDMVVCVDCPEKGGQPRENFYIHKTKKRGTVRIELRPVCKACVSKRARKTRDTNGSIENLVRRKAPLNALRNMAEDHPEILAEIAHRYRGVYTKYLDAERQRITTNMTTVIEANTRRGKYTYECLEKEYHI
jgi:hypothetical protein